jgi:predicted dienelactone hydrolase
MEKWIVALGRLLRGEQTRSSTLLSRAALLLALVGALGSVGFMLRAGHRNDSPILLALFAIWVLSPFVALIAAIMISKRWSILTRATLYGVMLIITVGSLAIYGNMVSAPPDSKLALPFLLVPLESFLLITIVTPLAALLSRTLSRFRAVRWLIKAVVTVFMLCVVGITVLVGLLLLDHNRDTTLPAPQGPFAVGRTTYVWSDPSQTDPLAPQPGTKRELLAWIWYPAAPRQPSQTMADYLPVPWRIAVEHQRGELINQLLTRDLSRVRTHSILEADVSTQQRSYPVVLMRAGLAGLVTGNSCLAEDLASHGYVVVGFDAPYRSSVVVFPNGTTIARAPQNNADLLSGLQQEQLATRLVQVWSADMAFALDQLERLNASDPSGRFLGRLDMQRVGVFGHSLGGATALQFCHDDSRCKAGIDVDGAPLGSVVRDGVTQPFMFLLSDHQSESDAETRQIEANIRSIFDRLPSDRRLWIMIRGANHFGFDDDGAMLKSPLLMQVLRALGIVHLNGRRQVALTAHCITTFFDVYLKGAPASQLKSLTEYPEIEIVP